MENESGELQDQNLKLLYLLVNNALDGKRIKFQFIKNKEELKCTKLLLDSTKSVVHKLKTVAKNIFDSYLILKQNPADSKFKNTKEDELLIEYKKLEYSAKFYQEELKVLKYMIREFRAYRTQHPLKVWIYNEERSESELVDYLKLPWRLW